MTDGWMFVISIGSGLSLGAVICWAIFRFTPDPERRPAPPTYTPSCIIRGKR